ncbi:hypothetical protein MYX75_03910 [Acidobacteria bacterium AH-259-A15]|nr:hypothetical protein [Acidobacteria bacterium AH-259-A15]
MTQLVRMLSGAVSLAAVIVGLGIGTTKPMPDHAILLVDDETDTYFALPCVPDPDRFRAGTVAEARKLNYKPDPECREQGWFIQERRSLTGRLLEALGILNPLPSRWNADGTWNW